MTEELSGLYELGEWIIDGKPCKVRVVGYVDLHRPDIAKKIKENVESHGLEKCFADVRILAYKPIEEKTT